MTCVFCSAVTLVVVFVTKFVRACTLPEASRNKFSHWQSRQAGSSCRDFAATRWCLADVAVLVSNVRSHCSHVMQDTAYVTILIAVKKISATASGSVILFQTIKDLCTCMQSSAYSTLRACMCLQRRACIEQLCTAMHEIVTSMLDGRWRQGPYHTLTHMMTMPTEIPVRKNGFEAAVATHLAGKYW